MGDNHIIRVIIQGYDRLSNVMQSAASRSGPALEGLRNKVRGLRTDNERSSQSFAKVASAIENNDGIIERSRVRLDRYTQAWNRLRNTIGQRFGIPSLQETPDELFNRLGREGNAPRVNGRFQSRADFVAEENQRRQEEASLRRQESLLNRIVVAKNKLFTGKSPFDDVVTGFKKGIDAINQTEGEQTERQKIRLKEQAALSEVREKRAKARTDLEEKLQESRNIALQGTQGDVKRINEQINAEKSAADRRISIERGSVGLFEETRQKRLDQFKRELEAETAKEELESKNRITTIRGESQSRLDVLRKEKQEAGKLREDDGGSRAQRQAAAQARQREVQTRITAVEKERNIQISAEEQNLDAFRRNQNSRLEALSNSLAQEIEKEREASREIVSNTQNESNQVVRIKRDEIKRVESDALQAANRQASLRKSRFDEETKRELDAVRQRFAQEQLSIPDLIRGRNQDRSDQFAQLPFIERQAARAGAAIDDLFRGFRGGRQNLEDFRGAAGRAQTTLAQIGAEAGKATRSLGSFINLRWLFLVSIFATLGTGVTELGAALVSVASSAALAAAALGGALLAGAGQAIPVFGLLAATFHNLDNAMKVVQLRQEARNTAGVDQIQQANAQRSANEGLADSHYALKQAIQSVADAEHNLREAHQRVTDAEKEQHDAVLDLADARRQATRNIVDSSFEERDARLSVKEAELGVLDAKRKLLAFENEQRLKAADLSDARAAVQEAQDRLKAAKQQGDATEIAAAQAALSAARGNVQSLKDQIAQTSTQQRDLQLGVQRAQLDQDQALVRRKRAIEDNARVQRQGIAGSPEVRNAVDRLASANRGLRDAIYGVGRAQRDLNDAHHNVVIAHRNIRDAMIAVEQASIKMSAAQRNATREFNKLSPAQRDFVRAMEEFQRTYRKYINPITDTITRAFSLGLRRATILLRDPAIRRSLSVLAQAIADIGNSFSKWVISPEGRRTIATFIQGATRNLPIIADAAGKFADALVRIATGPGTRLFNHLVDFVDRLATKFDDASKKSKGFQSFFEVAGRHLDAWLRLIGAVGNFLGALIGATAGNGLKMVNNMGDAFNDLANKIRKNHKAIREFLDQVSQGLGKLLPVLGQAFLNLVKAFTSPAFINFTTFLIQTALPGMLLVIKALGTFATLLTDIFKIPVIGKFAQWAAEIALGWVAMTRLFPVLKVVNPLLKTLFLSPISSVKSFIGIINKAKEALLVFTGIAKTEGFAAAFGAQFPKVEKIILKFKSFFIGAVAGMRGALIAFRATAIGAFVTNPWVIAIVGIIALIVLLDRKFHFLRPTVEYLGKLFGRIWTDIKNATKKFVDSMIELFTHPIKWLKQNWTNVIFYALLGGPIFIALKTFFPNFTKAIVDGFTGAFGALAKWFAGIGRWFNDHLINPIKHFFKIFSPSQLMFDIGKQVVQGFINAFASLPGLLLGVFKGLPGKIVGIFTGLGKKVYNTVKGGIEDAAKVGKKVVDKGKDVVTGAAHIVGHAASGVAHALGFGRSHHDTSPTDILAKDQQFHGGLITRLRGRGISDEDILRYMLDNGILRVSRFKQRFGVDLQDVQGFASGGAVQAVGNVRKAIHAVGGFSGGPSGTDTVPAWLTPGEWVLNAKQQQKLAELVGEKSSVIKKYLFGAKPENQPIANPKAPNRLPTGVQLIPHQDDYGITLWWIQMRDGTWAQVSQRAANNIIKTGGTWLPSYVRRNHGGASGTLPVKPGKPLMAGGGEVTFRGSRGISFGTPARGYAAGGIVTTTQTINSPSRGGNTVNQSFNVQTEGESDWNYIMRLGAQHAQESY